MGGSRTDEYVGHNQQVPVIAGHTSKRDIRNKYGP
jgi:hypothetical protein